MRIGYATRKMRVSLHSPCTKTRSTPFQPAFLRSVSIEARLIFAKGSVESTHKVPTSHYHTKHCHAAVVSLGGLRWTLTRVRICMIDFSQQSLWGNWFLHMIRNPPQSTFPGKHIPGMASGSVVPVKIDVTTRSRSWQTSPTAPLRGHPRAVHHRSPLPMRATNRRHGQPGRSLVAEWLRQSSQVAPALRSQGLRHLPPDRARSSLQRASGSLEPPTSHHSPVPSSRAPSDRSTKRSRRTHGSSSSSSVRELRSQLRAT